MKVRKIPRRRSTHIHDILTAKRTSGAAGKHVSIKDPKKIRKETNQQIKKGYYD